VPASTVPTQASATSDRQTFPGRNGNAWSRTAVHALFRLMIPNREWTLPALPGAAVMSARSADGTMLAGWAAPARAPADGGRAPGTVLFLHGMLRNCTMDGITDWAARVHARGLATAAVDLRFHGRSGDGLPGFGWPESDDVVAMLDALDRAGYPRPFLLIGGSLGALAAQLAAWRDARVAGALLLCMPGWPWHGAATGARAIANLAASEAQSRLGVVGGAVAAPVLRLVGRCGPPIGRLICRAHGEDMLGRGDIRRLPAPPPHRPLLAAAIGDGDVFGWHATWRAVAHWYGVAAVRRGAPRAGDDASFLLVPGVGHPPGGLLEWPGLDALMEAFVTAALARGDRAARDDRAGARSG